MTHRFHVLLAGLALALAAGSIPLRAQQAPAAPLNDIQKNGMRIFQQRCAVCHTQPTVVSKRYGPALYKQRPRKPVASEGTPSSAEE